MKKIWVMLLTLVLTLSAFTACGCTPQDMSGTSDPTRATTSTTPTAAPTMPATQPATEPETMVPTMPAASEDGSETGVIGSEEATTDASGASGASDPMERIMPRGRKSR